MKSLEESVPFYRDQLGLTLGGYEEVAEQKVRVAFFHLGNVRIELLEPTSPESPICKFLDQRGNGLHHLAFRTDAIVEDLAALQEKGVRLIDSTPRTGADHMQIAFLHPKATQGVLMELTQPHVE